MPSPKYLITGGTGLIGSHLFKHFMKEGKNVSLIGRKKPTANQSYVWDLKNQTMDEKALENTEAIIHLAGAGIADKRWTAAYKKEIIDSRRNSANLLFEKLKDRKSPVHTLISASATGYYGDQGDTWVEEDFKSRDDFMSETCRQWEESALQFEKIGIRVVIFRIGLVLSDKGGVLPSISGPVRFFAGAPIGSGKQYMSWIHIEDLCRMFSFALNNKQMHGIFNAVATHPVTNAEFIREIASVLHRPFWPFHIPSFLLKIILGEKAAIVLNGQRVSSEKIRMAGFEFKHTDLKKVLEEFLNTSSNEN